MPLLELSFASGEDSLSVRHFAVREEISSLFEVDVLARSPLEEIDLEGIVDNGAGFGFNSGVVFLTTTNRVWTGICSHMELIQTEASGLSTYFLKIVPSFWRTTLRRNNRIFQHQTIPAIVQKVLAEWQITPELKLSASYPTHEYRVQYGETDFAFVCRLLEEAGITYFFTHEPPQTKLVLTDQPTAPGARPTLPYVDNPNQEAEKEFVTKVKLTQKVKPGRFTFRDFDFRNQLDYQLFTEARAKTEIAYEQYHYDPGSFWVEPGMGGDTPVADDKGVARAIESEGKARATRELDGARRTRRVVSFKTNVLDLAPGALMAVTHPRADISSKKLLAIHSEIEGTPDQEWTITGEAVYADAPYRPERRTMRPRVQGVQSAVVVGPPGEEIHVDEFGRIRVQFHWDREGSYNDNSSCWIRVSQGWAGSGYGLINLPRVGQEVLVEFFEGDPDRPVVTGRVFSQTRRVIYKLPDDKTKSGWKSESSPGAGGFNELSFEDAKGREEIHIQAEKDFSELVKNNQSSTVLNNRSASITSNDSVSVGANQSFAVIQNQSHTVGANQSNNVGQSRSSVMGQADTVSAGELISGQVGKLGVGYSFDKDQNITITNSVASIVFTKDGISLDSKGALLLTADGLLKLSGGTVYIDGLPNVYVNCDAALAATVPTMDPVSPPSPPSGPGSGGATIEAQSVLSGQGKVQKPGGFKEVSMFLGAMKPPMSPMAAPPFINLGGVAAAIGAAVGAAALVNDAKEAIQSALHLDQLSGAMELFGKAKYMIEGGPMALLQLPEGKQLIGSVLANPITGSVTGKDIAGLLNGGAQAGIFHLASQKGVQQVMALRTLAAPPVLDGDALNNTIAQNIALGYSPADAKVAGLSQHGVALYQGNGDGELSKVVPGLPHN